MNEEKIAPKKLTDSFSTTFAKAGVFTCCGSAVVIGVIVATLIIMLDQA